MSHIFAVLCRTWARRGLDSLLVLPWVLLTACGPAGDSAQLTPGSTGDVPASTSSIRFTDATQASGLDFIHVNGASGEYYFVEMVGGGGAFFDYDNDGDLDVYLVQSTVLEPGTPPRVGSRVDLTDRLLRNDLDTPGAMPRFVDVTAESGLAGVGYGMGATVGDYDGDGWTDLYVTHFGSNRLWRNRGPGDDGRFTFEDVTEEAGVDDPRWSTSAVFLDYDRDGRQDLYVVNYVDYDLGDRRRCTSESGRRDYCGPQNYAGEPDRLLRNLGPDAGGVTRFEDVSGPAGILVEFGSGLGVVSGDVDGDGWDDLYVANDLMPNLLWRNQGDGSFRNEALLAGCAVNLSGAAEASMGVDSGDVDNDGDVDLFMTHLAEETHTLYLGDGHGQFEDRSLTSQLGAVSLPATGFGTVMVDLDSDGWLDLAAVNGAVHIIEAQARAGDDYPFDQPNQIFRNQGPDASGEILFADVSAEAGEAMAASNVSRGLAVGDVDNDGDADLLVINNQGPARLLLNEGTSGHGWLGLDLRDTAGRLAVGASVQVQLDDGRALLRRSRTAGSYAAAHDGRILMGLGAQQVTGLVITWPDGALESFDGLSADTYHQLTQGSGRPMEGAP